MIVIDCSYCYQAVYLDLIDNHHNRCVNCFALDCFANCDNSEETWDQGRSFEHCVEHVNFDCVQTLVDLKEQALLDRCGIFYFLH